MYVMNDMQIGEISYYIVDILCLSTYVEISDICNIKGCVIGVDAPSFSK